MMYSFNMANDKELQRQAEFVKAVEESRGLEVSMNIARLFAVYNGKRHDHYQRVTDKASFYKKVITGENQESLIISYKERETEEQKEQRIHLTNTYTREISNQVLAQFKKLKKADKLLDKVDHENSDILMRINEAIQGFYGKTTLDAYLMDNFIHYNAVDPNSMLLISYTVDQEIMPNPKIYKSEYVLDYGTTKGILDYAVFATKDYEIWAPNYQIVVQIVQEVEQLESNQLAYKINKKDTAVFTIVETDLGIVPAILLGTTKDNGTDLETYVGIVEPATSQIKDYINIKSEADLTRALHTFLQKMQLAEPCNYVHNGDICNGTGYLGAGKKRTQCPSCKGSGLKIHTTTQDILIRRMPDDGITDNDQKLIPLADMIHYVQMPFEIVNDQKDRLEKLPAQISVSIFGVNILDIPNNPATATQIRNIYDSLNAVLAEYGDRYAEIKTFCIAVLARILDIDNLVVSVRMPNDYKLATEQELLLLLSSAQEAGAPSEVKESIIGDIIAKQNSNNPAKVVTSKIKYKFMPFKNLTQQERLLVLSTLPDNNRQKVLYNYLDEIFLKIEDMVDIEQIQSTEAIRTLIDQQIDSIIESNFNTTSEINLGEQE